MGYFIWIAIFLFFAFTCNLCSLLILSRANYTIQWIVCIIWNIKINVFNVLNTFMCFNFCSRHVKCWTLSFSLCSSVTRLLLTIYWIKMNTLNNVLSVQYSVFIVLTWPHMPCALCCCLTFNFPPFKYRRFMKTCFRFLLTLKHLELNLLCDHGTKYCVFKQKKKC